MNTILTVFRKEFRSTLRDRKTLFSAIILPAIAMPLLLLVVTKLQQGFISKERSRTLKVAFYNAPPAITALFAADSGFRAVQGGPLQAARDSVAAEHYDAVLDFDPGFSAAVDSLHSGGLRLHYKSTNELAARRITEKLDAYEATVVSERFRRLQLPEEILHPLALNKVDEASTKEQIGMLVGGFIPYMFIIFCFLGCMYPALDLITGEKEKGTIETLLTVPASRSHMLFGKMLTIAAVGVCAALMTIGGLFAAVRLSSGIPADILATINDILSLRFILMLFAMLVPLSLFFAGLLSAIAVRAATFKEAQSYVTPLTFVVILPAMLAMMPGMKLTWQTVWIPILNIALATKEIVAGTINSLQYLALVVSLILLAVLAILSSRSQFSKEGNILK